MTEVIDGTLVPPLGSALPSSSRRQRAQATVRDVQRSAGWRRAHVRRLVVADLAVLVAVAAVTHLVVLGTTLGSTSAPPRLELLFEAALAVAWVVVLSVVRSRDARILGAGHEEWERVVRSTVLLFGWVAIASLMLQWNLSRGYLAMFFVTGLAALLLHRFAWRRWLRRERVAGRKTSNVLVVGGLRNSLTVSHRLSREGAAGLGVRGVWVPDGEPPVQWADLDDRRVPVMGMGRSLAEAVAATGADAVVVTDTEHLGPDGMRDLSWDLEGLGVELMVAPNVLDVARPRLHVQARGSLALLHLDVPRYEGASRLGKNLFDRTFALLAIVATSPVLVATAIAVKLTSPGPVFYRQERIGIDGLPFMVWKFRSMRVDADQELVSLLEQQGSADTPLFKIDDDPRITGIGGFLRRYSIDELPQFFNVLTGEMSVVGPRPQIAAEVALYGRRDHHRLRVRPGITGLWQVSGRSDLPWEEAIRLDLDYVENWSMVRDLQIAWKTLGAVASSAGAR
jgi:exopolysaccharide biosynthesis polyprenyl glycosylphosphotransferase